MINRDEVNDKSMKMDESEDDDDTKYANSDDDLLEEDISKNEEFDEAHET